MVFRHITVISATIVVLNYVAHHKKFQFSEYFIIYYTNLMMRRNAAIKNSEKPPQMFPAENKPE